MLVTLFTMSMIVEAPFHFTLLCLATDFRTAYRKFEEIAKIALG